MIEKALPFSASEIKKAVDEYETPFYLYDEKGIRENARRFKAAFSWVPDFREYFAVKATPNPHILKILHEEGLEQTALACRACALRTLWNCWP